MQKTTPTNDIAVIGLSCYYPGSKTPKAFWQNILSKRQQFRELPDCRLPLKEYWHPEKKYPDTTYGRKAALMDGYNFDWRKRKITKTSYESTDIVQWLALDTALAALEDAGLDYNNMSNKKSTGVVVGNSLTGEFTRSEGMRLRWPFIRKVLRKTASQFEWSSEKMEEFEKEMEILYKSVFAPVTEDSLSGGLANTIAGRICNFCDFNGGGYLVDGACSSSILSIVTAANALVSKEMDVVIAGGVDISLDTFELVGFSKAGALTEKEMKVYDENRSGFMPGEGCGMVVLKRLEDAKRDGDKIYSVLKGWGISSDGKGGITAPSSTGQSMSLIRAYERAGIKPEQLNFIEGHGTGTVVGDLTELNAIKKTFDHFSSNHEKNCGITSLKSVVGHTKAAAGIGAFIKTSIALNQRVVPPTCGVDKPNNVFGSANFPLYPVITAKKHPKDAILNAGVSAMGFGGINSHVVLSSGDKPFSRYKTEIDEEKLSFSNQDSEIFVFSAKNQDLLVKKLEVTKDDFLGISYAELSDCAKLTSDNISTKEKFKCSFVVKNPDELQRTFSEIIRYLDNNIVEEGSVFKSDKFSFSIGNKVKKQKIAFLFPGQGSQRLNSSKILTQKFSWAKKSIDDLDRIANKEVGYTISDKSFFDISKTVNDEDISDLSDKLRESQIAQAAIVSSSLIWGNFLKKLGIKPSAVCGHSLGELVALQEVGAYDEKTLLKLAVLRGFEMSKGKVKGKMLSLGCDENTAKDVIGKIKDVEIANLNSAEQTIVSGSSKGIDEVFTEAKKRSLSAHPLSVSNAFHSKMMNGAAKDFGKKLKLNKAFEVKKSKDSACFLSSKSGEKLTSKLDLNDHLISQITSPVRFIDMVNNLSKTADFVIEVGSGEILSRLISRITNGETPCQSVEKTPGSFFEINYLLANLFVRGVEINWDALYEDRLILPFVKISQLDFITNPLEKPLGDSSENDAYADINNHQSYKSKDISTGKEDSKTEFSTVENLLITVAAKKTGFDEDSISLKHRILDDLNLDSIKSGEFVGEVTRTLGIKSVDVSKFANSTLEEVAKSLKEEITNTDNLEISSGSNDNWARTFVLEKTQDKLVIDNKFLKNKKVVIAGFESSDLSKNLLSELNKTSKASYFDFNSEKGFKNFEGQHVILLMPKQVMNSKDLDVQNRVQTISKLNKIPFKAIESLSVVHFSNEIQSLFASIYQENPSLKVRVIDICNDFDLKKLPKNLPGIIGGELQGSSGFITASYDEKHKYIKHPVLAPESIKDRDLAWNEKDIVLVTAGAKGITKECVLDWAKNKNLKLILLGRSKDSDEGVKKSLLEFEESKISCHYYSCDVSDEKSVKKVIKSVQKEFGNITGVVHGAGTNSPRLFDKVSGDEAFLEVSPKVLGITNIINNVDPKHLKMVSVISSIIGYTGMQGNSWYAWSNETIEKLLTSHQSRNSHTQICSMSYTVWDEVGMGARMGSVSTLANMGVLALSRKQGVDSFTSLMNKDFGSNEYLIVSEMGELGTWNRKLPTKPKADRFLEKTIKFEPGVELVSEIDLNLETDLYVADHDFQGSFLFPTVFGLEAMAQNVAHLMGMDGFNTPIQINDLHLDKPIVVDADKGKKIRVRSFAKTSYDIYVEITTEDTGFAEKYFYAHFNLRKFSSKTKSSIKYDSKLSIDPKEDLYGGLLFQGPLYQKIDSLSQISTDKVICNLDSKYSPKTTKSLKFFGKGLDNELLLGNPFTRDALLQSVQLCNADKQLLPVKIERISLFNISQSSNLVCETIINDRGDDGVVDSDVTLFGDKEALEVLTGYKTKVVGNSIKLNYTTDDLLDPSKYDLGELNDSMKIFSKESDFEYPSLGLSYVSDLVKMSKNVRHDKEKEIFDQAINDLSDIKREIIWDSNGKPLVKSKKGEQEIHVSLSHDDKMCITTAGLFSQGCDVEPIKSRSLEEWNSLLANHLSIWKEVAKIADKDISGTLVWSVVESVKKSGIFLDSEEYKLSLTSSSKDNYLFNIRSKSSNVNVASIIFQGSRPLKRVFSCVVEIEQEERNEKPISSSGELVKDIFTSKRRGENNEEIYIHRFRTTFKEANSVDRTLHYPIFASWMGKLRELPLQAIAPELIEDMTSGLWGMVTNSSYIKIVGTANSLDLIEGHFWVSRCYGPYDSTTDLCFKWHKVLEDGSLEVIAYSFLPTTWVKVKGHGIVETSPFPEYFQKWIDSIVAKNSQENYLETINDSPTRCDIGKLLLENNVPLQNRDSAFEVKFSTSLDESNLVGNVYYAHYYSWQAKAFDQFIYKVIPDFYLFSKEQRRFICLDVKVQHLREAMPFDTIEVKLYIDEVHEYGLKLSYEFFCISRGEPEKLAWGQQKVALVEGPDEKLCKIPEIISKNCK